MKRYWKRCMTALPAVSMTLSLCVLDGSAAEEAFDFSGYTATFVYEERDAYRTSGAFVCNFRVADKDGALASRLDDPT